MLISWLAGLLLSASIANKIYLAAIDSESCTKLEREYISVHPQYSGLDGKFCASLFSVEKSKGI